MELPIYFDHHATTPIAPSVLESMMPYLTKSFGNASSTTHAFGQQARLAVEQARKQIADLIGASPEEILFTSGATESDNLAIKGRADVGMGRNASSQRSEKRHRETPGPKDPSTNTGRSLDYRPI